jgi:hypothetical protein
MLTPKPGCVTPKVQCHNTITTSPLAWNCLRSTVAAANLILIIWCEHSHTWQHKRTHHENPLNQCCYRGTPLFPRRRRFKHKRHWQWSMKRDKGGKCLVEENDSESFYKEGGCGTTMGREMVWEVEKVLKNRITKWWQIMWHVVNVCSVIGFRG